MAVAGSLKDMPLWDEWQEAVREVSRQMHEEEMAREEAERQVFKEMTAAEKRVGGNDCKIAAIAMSRGLVVVTRNVRDFAQINGVTFQDWTMP